MPTLPLTPNRRLPVPAGATPERPGRCPARPGARGARNRVVPTLAAAAVAACATLLTWGAGEARAQSIPDQGSWFITAAFPDGGGNEAGIWHLLGSRTAVGFEVDFRYTRVEDSASSINLGPDAVNRSFRFTLGPTFKRYLRDEGRIVPYVRASVAIGWSDDQLERPPSNDVERDTTDKIQLVRAALGADWFPVDNLGIGAFTGIVGVHDRLDVQISQVGQVTRKTWTWNTFKSGVEIQYYF